MKDGYKDVSDLYARGEVLELMNGKLVWVQVLNSFELEECRTAARVARARLVNALKHEDSSESQIVRSQFREGHRDVAIDSIMSGRQDEISLKIAMEVESDPEWNEAIELVKRGKDVASRGPTDEESEALNRASAKYVDFIQSRVGEETELMRAELEALSDEQLEQEVLDEFVKRQGERAAYDEYRLCEMALAARTCDAKWVEEEGRWDHAIPVSEREPIWTKEEMRGLPEQLQMEIQTTLRSLSMTGQQAKGSAAQPSSSDSSQPPSEEAALQPSTPTETSSSHPGS